MAIYQVLSLDIWAGDEEGTYEKNNFYNLCRLEIDSLKAEDIIEALIEEGCLYDTWRGCGEVINHDCDGHYIEIVERGTNFPVYDLRLIED